MIKKDRNSYKINIYKIYVYTQFDMYLVKFTSWYFNYTGLICLKDMQKGFPYRLFKVTMNTFRKMNFTSKASVNWFISWVLLKKIFHSCKMVLITKSLNLVV